MEVRIFSLIILGCCVLSTLGFVSNFNGRTTQTQNFERCMSRQRPLRSRIPRLHVTMDFYDTLGVSRSATEAEIKSGFRKMARKYHPDINPAGEEQFKEVSRAYEVLSDPQQRQRYDQFGEAGLGGMGGGGAGVDIDLSDIFESFFGGGGGGMGGGFGGGGGARREGPTRGDDLRIDLDLDFRTACFGGDEKVRVRHLETCETCTGSGVKPGAQVTTCSQCSGSGVVTQVAQTPFGAFQSRTTCPNCRGTGQSVSEYCGACSGQGVQEKAKQVKVKVPCGVEAGNRLRVRGEGDAGRKGGPAGDLYVFVNVKKDPDFKREGMDVYSEIAIPFTDAILGNEKQTVKTIDGTVDIKVPQGTQPGTVLRVRGKGAPKLNALETRGDQYVTVKVDIPKKVDGRAKELVEELATLQKQKGDGIFSGFGFGKKDD